MKRSLAIVVSIAFLGTSLSVPAFAAVKAGATCSKAGKTSIASGKTFTCVKNGKKLTWNKGVAIAKPAAVPAPIAPTSPEPVAVKIPAMPTSFADLEENYQGIPHATWEKIQNNLALHKSTDLKISFQFGPTTPQRYPNQWTIDAVTLGSRVMGAQKQPAEVKFVQYNKADVPWARTEAEKYISPFNLGMSFPDQAAEKCSGVDCDGAVTNIASDIGLVLVGVANPVNRFNIQKFNGQNDLHEYTHAVQGMVFKGKSQSPPPVLMPCWYSEGQPQAVSIPTVAKSAEDYVKIRKGWITDNRWALKDYEPETIQQFLKDNMKVPCPGNTYAMVFSLGYIVMDALVAVGGIDKTFDVLTARADGLSFEEAFKKVYGISWDEASVVISKAVSKVYKENKK
ncbi:hypothetical protein MCEMRE130_00293 [Candidatus Nanopelagicaceae bacterium]